MGRDFNETVHPKGGNLGVCLRRDECLRLRETGPGLTPFFLQYFPYSETTPVCREGAQEEAAEPHGNQTVKNEALPPEDNMTLLAAARNLDLGRKGEGGG